MKEKYNAFDEFIDSELFAESGTVTITGISALRQAYEAAVDKLIRDLKENGYPLPKDGEDREWQ